MLGANRHVQILNLEDSEVTQYLTWLKQHAKSWSQGPGSPPSPTAVIQSNNDNGSPTPKQIDIKISEDELSTPVDGQLATNANPNLASPVAQVEGKLKEKLKKKQSIQNVFTW